jgi:hypothetical protein
MESCATCAEDCSIGETCNGEDDDCDGVVDEEYAAACAIYFLDGDADSFGVTDQVQCLCAPAGQYSATLGTDCNDADNTINPGAVEKCNGKDDNCDGEVDGYGVCAVVVDGMDADWTVPAPLGVNVGRLGSSEAYRGEYVWSDRTGDERTQLNSMSPDLLTWHLPDVKHATVGRRSGS